MPGTLGTGLDTPYQYDIYVGMWNQARSSRKKKEMTTTRFVLPHLLLLLLFTLTLFFSLLVPCVLRGAGTDIAMHSQS
uniref:Uncharacterized protein n=1 Tax=Oryza barthii TaxID=65489 RepID=A0A0D3GRS7_9ORYZ